MSPITVEIAKSLWLDEVTLKPGEMLTKGLGGDEGVKVERFSSDEGDEETYSVAAVDSDNNESYQRVVVSSSDGQPDAHFWIGDTKITATCTQIGQD